MHVIAAVEGDRGVVPSHRWQVTCKWVVLTLMPVRAGQQSSEPNCEIGSRYTAERPERRKRPRTHLRWQVDLLAVNEAGIVESVTRDLSSIGFYCCAPVPFVPGARMTCILKVPTYHPKYTDRLLPLECQIHIVRVDPADEQGFYGLGCEIDDYRFLHIL